MPIHLNIRLATQDDLTELANLNRLAFSPPQTVEQIKAHWFHNQLDQPGRRRYLAIDLQTNLAVGAYTILDLRVWFMGQTIPATGVAGICVAPHKRGQGISKQLIEHGLNIGHAEHIPLTMLYPFHHGFYRQFGWAWVGQSHQYRISSHHLPLYAQRNNIYPYNPLYRKSLTTTYEEAAVSHNGWLHRQDWQWNDRLRDIPGREIYIYRGNPSHHSIEGYVIYQFLALESNWSVPTVIVQEWVALNMDAYKGILGFFAALKDQVSTIIWNTYPDDLFPNLLMEQRQNPQLQSSPFHFGLTHPLGKIGAGFMWRLVDIFAAMNYRPISQGKAFQITFRVIAPKSSQVLYEPFTVHFSEGRMHRVETSFDSPQITLSLEHLTQLFFGFRRVAQLKWTGELQVEGNENCLSQLDRAWTTSPPFCWDFF